MTMSWIAMYLWSVGFFFIPCLQRLWHLYTTAAMCTPTQGCCLALAGDALLLAVGGGTESWHGRL